MRCEKEGGRLVGRGVRDAEGEGGRGGGTKAPSISLSSFFPPPLWNMMNEIPVITIPSSFSFSI